MRSGYALAIPMAIVLGTGASASLAAEASPREPGAALQIGSVAEVDTQALRRLIDESTQPGVAPEPAEPPLSLALEEAIRTALEANLQLQIAALDVGTTEALVPAARAKFHPTPGVDAIA